MSRKYFFTIVFCFLYVLLGVSAVFASTSNGTVDSTYKYAWGENIGWINFGSSEGNVHITDDGLTGYAWSENYGWINLHANDMSGGSVMNDGNGNLGGNAWAEGFGWIDFTGVTIDADGYFNGYATVLSDGSLISLNCVNTSSCTSSDFKVRTDWRANRGGINGGRVLGVISCTNGVMDGDETGIDCGGSCDNECPVSVFPPTTPNTPEEILDSGPCPSDLLVIDNMKRGNRDGRYSLYNQGTVTQVKILQAHINRILAVRYQQAAGPVDGIFGPLTELGVKRLQVALNETLKPTPLLVVDGIVGPFTKTAINNSCGNVILSPSASPSYMRGFSGEIEVKMPENTITNNISNAVGNFFRRAYSNLTTYINENIIKPTINTAQYFFTIVKTSFFESF